MGGLFGSISELAMFMLYIVILGLLLRNADSFGTILNSVGSNWVRMLRTLQGAD
jgi:hypothetical protein